MIRFINNIPIMYTNGTYICKSKNINPIIGHIKINMIDSI